VTGRQELEWDLEEDRHWMVLALAQATAAEQAGEVPVGAVLVRDGKCLAQAHNAPIMERDPTAHAEIRALRSAARQEDNYRLPGTTLYVTLEPCPMCVGAMIHARVERLVYGAPDPRTGAAGSALDLVAHPSHNHRMFVTGGVLAEQAADQLKAFFRARRRSGSSQR
jgi:tRNA(adenine34) deaminase